MTTNQQKPDAVEPQKNESHFYTGGFSPQDEAETIKRINENQYKTFHNNLYYGNRAYQQGNMAYTFNKKQPQINTIVNFSTEKLLNEYLSEIKYILIYSVLMLVSIILIFIRDVFLVNTYKNTNRYILSLVFSTICISFLLLYIIFVFKKVMRDKYKFLYFRAYAVVLVCLIIFTFSLEPFIFLSLDAKFKQKVRYCLELAKRRKICDPSHKTLLRIMSGVIAVCFLILIKFLVSFLIRSIKILKGSEKEVAQKELEFEEKEGKLKKD